ncbi:hypothetical protein EXIGLDRAFT_725307 [Exidia glandulosa HHB12029]|uniref:Uncharacterized protein n=1 Tax=Exidia glandulosa HHB12029 TaxID=1314781 RepID=A0A165MJG5_EXIGL|nr:hypothetical protein EXIGLDRAFT_725307 [Exidia glandulosa HHB12029]
MSSCACAAKDAKIRELQAALVALAKQHNPKWYDEAVQKMREAEAKRAQLEVQLDEVVKERDQLLSNTTKAGSQAALFDELKRELASIVEERKEEATQLTALQTRFMDLSSAHTALQSEKKAQATEFAALETRLFELSDAHGALQSEKKAQATEFAALETRLSDLSIERDALESEKNDAVLQVAALLEQVRELTAAHATLLAENNAYAASLQESATNVQAFAEASDSVQAELSEAREEIKTLSSRLKESDEIILFLDRLIVNRGPVTTLATKLALLEQEVTDNRAVKVQLEASKAKNQDYTEQIRDLTGQKRTATSVLQSMEAHLHNLRQENEQLQEELANYRAQPQSRVVLGPSNSQGASSNATSHTVAKENDDPLRPAVTSPSVLKAHPDVTRNPSFFAHAAEHTVASLAEPARCRMWQDIVLIPRPGYKLRQRLLYGSYVGDCERPGFAPPADFRTFFSMIRYDYFKATLQEHEGEYFICGVTMRGTELLEAVAAVPPRPTPAHVIETSPAAVAAISQTTASAASTSTSPTTGTRPTSSSRNSGSSSHVAEASQVGKRKEPMDESTEPPVKRRRSTPVEAPTLSPVTRTSPLLRAPSPSTPIREGPLSAAQPDPSPSRPCPSSPDGPAEYDPDHLHTSPWDVDDHDFFVLWLRHEILNSITSASVASSHLQRLGWAEDGKGFVVPHKSKYFRNARFSMKTVVRALGH